MALKIVLDLTARVLWVVGLSPNVAVPGFSPATLARCPFRTEVQFFDFSHVSTL